MRLVIKEDVQLDGLQLPMLRALYLAAVVYDHHGATSITVTSAVRPGGRSFSLHPSGRALDLRIWNLADPPAVAQELAALLGPDYDVVVEDDHIHIEHDPVARPAAGGR